MLRINAKIAKPHVGDAGGDVIGLVDGESIKPGRDSGAHDRSRYEEKKHTGEETCANRWCVPVSCVGYCKFCCLAKNVRRFWFLGSAFYGHFRNLPGEVSGRDSSTPSRTDINLVNL